MPSHMSVRYMMLEKGRRDMMAFAWSSDASFSFADGSDCFRSFSSRKASVGCSGERTHHTIKGGEKSGETERVGSRVHEPRRSRDHIGMSVHRMMSSSLRWPCPMRPMRQGSELLRHSPNDSMSTGVAFTVNVDVVVARLIQLSRHLL